MTNLIFISLIYNILNLLYSNPLLSFYSQSKEIEKIPLGFIFVDFSKINSQNGAVSFLSQKGDTILHLQNRIISMNGIRYKVYEEEHLYKKFVDVEVFEPEYGLFILKCYGKTDKFYKVKLNGNITLVSTNLKNNCIHFKNLKQYIMGSYPVPTLQNPLRMNPNENADIVNNFDKWTYLPIKIKGDWVKMIDDKDCYSGEAPSPIDISGWIRWRKDGKFIIKVAHTC
jgi:hypothetical protein